MLGSQAIMSPSGVRRSSLDHVLSFLRSERHCSPLYSEAFRAHRKNYPMEDAELALNDLAIMRKPRGYARVAFSISIRRQYKHRLVASESACVLNQRNSFRRR